MNFTHFIRSKARNPVTHKRSYQQRFLPGGLVVLTTNKKVNILKVRFSAGRIRIIEEPQLRETGLVLNGVARKKLRRGPNFETFNVTSFTYNGILPFVNYARRFLFLPNLRKRKLPFFT